MKHIMGMRKKINVRSLSDLIKMFSIAYSTYGSKKSKPIQTTFTVLFGRIVDELC